jgi:hypothetical protein
MRYLERMIRCVTIADAEAFCLASRQACRRRSWLFALGWVACGIPASAQSNEQRADDLFRQGQDRLQIGRTREACVLLASSHRLDPALGTLLNLALCHEKEGKIATAHREYVAAATWAKERNESEREHFARQRASSLEGEIPKLRVEIAGAPRDIRVQLDGRAIDGAELEGDIAVDPGPHRLEVTAAGRKAWHKGDLRIEPRSRTLLQVALEDATPVDAAASTSGPTSMNRPVLGYVAGGAAVASLGAGIALLLRAGALDAQSDSDEEQAKNVNPPDPALKAAALASHESAVTSQTLGFVSMGVGSVGALACLYFFLSARGAEAPAASALRLVPNVGSERAGLEMRARF